MARRRLTPAQPGYLVPASETKAMPFATAPPIAKVSGQSAEAAALRELSEGIQAARNEGRMIVDVPLADVSATYLLRDRISLDREELESLKASIRTHGQRTPAEITSLDGAGSDPVPYRFGLISGWRRLRALSELFEETGDARFSTIRALIQPAAEAGQSYVAMIEENEVRVGLSYYERARVVAETTAQGVFPDHATALRVLFATASRAKRSKIGSFVTLCEALGDVLRFPSHIPERLGLTLTATVRDNGPDQIRSALAEANAQDPAHELKVLETCTRIGKAPVARTKPVPERLAEGVDMTVEQHRSGITITLNGAGVDDALLSRLRRALHD